MRFLALAFVVYGTLVSTPLRADTTLRTAAEIRQALNDTSNRGRRFEIEAAVVYTFGHDHCSAVVTDASGPVRLYDGTEHRGKLLAEDAIVRIRGRLLTVPDPPHGKPAFHAVYDNAESTGDAVKAMPFEPWDAEAETSFSGRRVCITGILRDVFRDEIDPNFTFVVVNSRGNDTYAIFSTREDPSLKARALVGFEVSLKGFLPPGETSDMTRGEGRSRRLTPIVLTHPNAIRPTSDAPLDLFAVPCLPPLAALAPAAIGSLGRRKVEGTVITRWSENNILLKTDDDRLVFAALSDGRTPARGTSILVSGVPDANVYFIRLRHAAWRRLPGTGTLPDDPIVKTDLQSLFSTPAGKRRYASPLNGATVCVRGRLLGVPPSLDDTRLFNLEDSGCILSVDYSAVPDALRQISPGSLIDVTGTCIIQLESAGAIPRVCGLSLIVNTASDIVVVRRPPWWTTGKFVSLLSALLVLLVGVLTWSLTLKRLSEHRARELAEERIAVVESELKVYERTRLAIELHDMLSQMLSGISMQIDTVRKFFDTDRTKSLHHLGIAAKTLLACRGSLRDCLWDLRNHALEEPDMAKAIRETLEPHIEDANVVIRFSVPRDRLTDNTAHTILNIVRELVVNAFRHGKARTVRIAGCVEDGKILFSVTDDGCGFDPANAPGAAQGHFGLQGIRERIEGFEGEISISSKNGRGTKVSIGLNLPKEEAESNVNR